MGLQTRPASCLSGRTMLFALNLIMFRIQSLCVIAFTLDSLNSRPGPVLHQTASPETLIFTTVLWQNAEGFARIRGA